MKISTIKKILKNPKMFLRIIFSKRFFNILDDETYLKIKWKLNMGNELNLVEPQTFNEKLQWLKIHDRKPYYSQLVDKYEAKVWAGKIIGEEYIVPNLGVWDTFDEIEFEKLPKQFVLKCTHDSGGLIICRDKNKLDINQARKVVEKSYKRNFYWSGREWPYKNVKPRIIAEKFMSDGRTEEMGLTDFKFFCFNGKPEFIYISHGLENHDLAGISFYDLKGNKLPFKRMDYKEIPGEQFPLPNDFDEMVNIAEKLAIEVRNPFVRVDLYEIEGNIYFSEITFFPCSGFIPFDPCSVDKELGKLIDLTPVLKKKN